MSKTYQDGRGAPTRRRTVGDSPAGGTTAAFDLRPASPSRSPAASARAAAETAAAFDLRRFNPVQWSCDASFGAGALGPLDLLPPGAPAGRVARRRTPLRLRRYHHLVDVKAFHEDAASRAGELVRLAAAGVVIHVADDDDRLRALLDSDLHRLMSTHPGAFDAGERELHSIRMRRAALQAHSSWSRGKSVPPVSVVVASKRPEMLPRVLDAVARQTYPRLELVLAVHGDAKGFEGIEATRDAMPVPATVVRAHRDEPLGAVLNEACAAASGTLLTKMDDDDVYGADHVWDLVLARVYADATLVGKVAQFVHLADAELTVHVRRGQGEAYRRELAGGTLLIARSDLERIGGWRNVPRAVDGALEEDVVRAGGVVYTTHGAGFVLVRHGRSHTWGASDAFFLELADRIAPGWTPAIAGMDGECGVRLP